MDFADQHAAPDADGAPRPRADRVAPVATDPHRNEHFPDPRRRWSADERESLDRLLPVIHVELLKVANALLQRDEHGQRLEAAGLIQAGLIRLAQRHGAQWRSRTEFFRWTATILRHVLVDHVRSQRRAGALRGEEADARQAGLSLLAVDDALRRLEAMARSRDDVVATAPQAPRGALDASR